MTMSGSGSAKSWMTSMRPRSSTGVSRASMADRIIGRHTSTLAGVNQSCRTPRISRCRGRSLVMSRPVWCHFTNSYSSRSASSMAGYGGRGSFWGTDDEKISGWRFNHVMSS